MFLLPVNVLAALTPDDDSEFARKRIRAEIDDAALAKIQQLTTLKHARYSPLATALGELALQRLKPYSSGKAKAVLTVGDGLHLAVARAFLDRLHNAGSRFVNPIMFPNTLPSACAVALGAIYEAHVCAFNVDGPDPVRRALHVCELLLNGGVADEVLFLAFDLPEFGEAVAIGQLVSRTMLGKPSVELHVDDRTLDCPRNIRNIASTADLAELINSEFAFDHGFNKE